MYSVLKMSLIFTSPSVKKALKLVKSEDSGVAGNITLGSCIFFPMPRASMASATTSFNFSILADFKLIASQGPAATLSESVRAWGG
ncbi:hypothetical protein ACJBU6_07317 [Exserohilum turcicum]